MPNSTTSFDFAIIGGGILGVAVAALASAAGYSPVVFRLKDDDFPRADTLRNQGWLQTGIMYSRKGFDDQRFKAFAYKTYFEGRAMLRESGIPLPTDSGVVGIKGDENIRKFELKAKLLDFTNDDFRRLEDDEAKTQLEDCYNSQLGYFRIPDGPFDEAGVLSYLRSEAKKYGAVFIQVSEPVELERRGASTIIKFDGNSIESPTTLITAGTGSFNLINQIGHKLNGVLRRTPLLVGSTTPKLPASILIDLELGYSAVQHQYLKSELKTHPSTVGNPIVVGGRSNLMPAENVIVDNRNIPPGEREKLQLCIPEYLMSRISNPRYTAGYEVIPNPETKISEYEPWVEDFGNVLFASPGRATVTFLAARRVLASLIPKLNTRAKKIQSDFQDFDNWDEQIKMHYQPSYNYCDAE